MVYSKILSPKFIYINPKLPKNPLPPPSLQFSRRERRHLFLPISVSSIPYQPINVDYLEQEFSGHGVTFEAVGEDQWVAKMELQNGSSAKLMLPGGLVSSYKASMWHGGNVELLHTIVSEGENGEPVVQGGVSLALLFVGENNESSWSPATWNLNSIEGDDQDSIQVELISSEKEKMVETKQILTLREKSLSLNFEISNQSSSPLQLTGSIISHLTVSTPEATYAVGLERSNFRTIPPFSSNFSLVPPIVKESRFEKFLSQIAGRGSNPNSNIESKGSQEETETEEEDNCKQLSEVMSSIYTCAPSYFSIIDRGRRNSVVIGREGFDELYMFSPGSRHDMYSTNSFICVGQSATLKPIIISPGEVWRGAQHLQNPNMS